MMEFSSVINKLLAKEPEARRRLLSLSDFTFSFKQITGIKTYAVVPLNEECGLIEWVYNTAGVRPIISPFHPKGVQVQFFISVPHIFKAKDLLQKDNPASLERILYLLPPVFHKWFLQQFTEPSCWFDVYLMFSSSFMCT